jgi:hypothetical protein
MNCLHSFGGRDCGFESQLGHGCSVCICICSVFVLWRADHSSKESYRLWIDQESEKRPGPTRAVQPVIKVSNEDSGRINEWGIHSKSRVDALIQPATSKSCFLFSNFSIRNKKLWLIFGNGILSALSSPFTTYTRICNNLLHFFKAKVPYEITMLVVCISMCMCRSVCGCVTPISTFEPLDRFSRYFL